MSRKQYLHRRNGMWSFRRKFPKEVIAILGKEHFNRALGTSDLKQANTQRPFIEIEFNDIVDKALRSIKPTTQITSISDAEITRLVVGYMKESVEIFEDSQLSPAWEGDEGFEYSLEQELEDTLGMEAEAEDMIALKENTSAGIRADILLKDANISIPKDSLQYKRLCLGILRAGAEVSRIHYHKLKGDFKYTPADPAFKDYTSYEPPQNTTTLNDLIEAYLEDLQRKKRSPATLKKYKPMLNLFKDVLGAKKPINQIDRAMCTDLRNLLENFPANQNKLPKLVGKNPNEVVRLNKQLGHPLMAPETINDYLRCMSTLFKWGVTEHLIDRNPALDLSVPTTKKDKDKRQPFSMDNLQAIFQTLLYTGSLDDQRGYAVAGPNIIRRGRFWVPLLALWTGMRLGECCQLHVKDITKIDGIDVILINDDNGDVGQDDAKLIKTKAGNRYIPIHPELIKLGFMQHVQDQQKVDAIRLFPELKKSKSGSYSQITSQWFGRFLEHCDVKEANTSFHSFRHNFRDALREAEVPLEKAKALGGWSQGNDTSDDYGSGFKASTLYAEIIKIEYPDLDLSHLYINCR